MRTYGTASQTKKADRQKFCIFSELIHSNPKGKKKTKVHKFTQVFKMRKKIYESTIPRICINLRFHPPTVRTPVHIWREGPLECEK